MRWNTAKRPAPKGGDRRSIINFAWKPTQVGEKTVWLERYEVYQSYFEPSSGNPGWWVEISRRTLEYYL